MRNAIVTAADSKYLPAACCTLVSCIEDGETEAPAQLFLLACEVSREDAEKAHSYLKSRDVSVEIIEIGADHFRPFRIDGYISGSTYSRLFLPEFFDDRWDRLLYLDADMRVMVRLQPLLHANLHGNPVGAVLDYLKYLIYGIGSTRARLGLRSNSPYFNAGVMCFDWRTTIASGLLQRAQAFATENASLCETWDQDALNKAFEGAWTPLDPRWNFMTMAVPDDVFRLYYPARLRPYIAHFAGPVKPWMGKFPDRFEHHHAWYRDLLRDSPWPDFGAPVNVMPTLAPSLAHRLEGWFLAQRGRLQAPFQRFSVAMVTAAQRPRNARQWKSALSEAWRDDGANPKLANLFDQMIADAVGSDGRDAC